MLPFCCLHSAFYSVSLKIFLHHLLDFIPLDSQILYTRNSLFSTGPAPTCVSLYYTMSTGWYAPRARYNGIDSRPHATGIVGSGIHNTCPCPFSPPLKLSPALCRAPGSGQTPAKQEEAGGAGNLHPAEGRSLTATHKAVFPTVPTRLCNGRLFHGLLSTPQTPARSWGPGSRHLVP